ncbi:hypothetical protein [Marinoscillum sp. MHG1-6]|uniref:hypothetical protein n=1 Tax=Marinoscillum sp. MHG1-6 TaxID=2959627 RepID=UPI0021577C67|nr:hypothetical protein [Marinoscillum sp. MHG1-6]
MKSFFSFILGLAAGLGIAYYADPKGSQAKLKKLEKELKKNRKVLDQKLDEYKSMYNGVVDKYAKSSKDLIESAKGTVENVKKSVKAH